MIEISSLSHAYSGAIKALNDITMEIPSGVFGLVGPNGAGKTTLMRIMATLLNPTSGSVSVNGFDVGLNRQEVRKIIGYLPQSFSTFPKLKTREFLEYSAILANVNPGKTVDDMLERVGLKNSANVYIEKLSGGMTRRLGIAQALIGSPKIIIVDEPTAGLDPEERLRFRNLLADLSREDVTVILSTHIIEDISSSCQNMAVLNRGRVVFYGSPERLIQKARGHAWKIMVNEAELENVKSQCSVIVSIPREPLWEVQVVAETLDGWDSALIEPKLEHAYVYFSKHVLKDAMPVAS